MFAVNGSVDLPDEGKVIKKKNRHYSLLDKEDNILIENIIDEENRIDPQVSLETRRFSLELRHQIHPKYICQQIDKSNDVITSFSKAVNRIMKRKYIDANEISGGIMCSRCSANGKMIEMHAESGCWRCPECNDSRCG